MAEVETGGVQDLRQDLEGLDESRAGAVEVLMAVGERHLSRRHGAKSAELGGPGQRADLAARPRQVEAAGQDNDDVRVGLGERLEGGPG